MGTQIPVIGILSLWFQKCRLPMGGKKKGLMTPSGIRGFSSKLMDDSTEACWMWKANALALIEKGYSKKAIEVEMRKSLASYSQGLWFREKHLLGHSLH